MLPVSQAVLSTVWAVWVWEQSCQLCEHFGLVGALGVVSVQDGAQLCWFPPQPLSGSCLCCWLWWPDSRWLFTMCWRASHSHWWSVLGHQHWVYFSGALLPAASMRWSSGITWWGCHCKLALNAFGSWSYFWFRFGGAWVNAAVWACRSHCLGTGPTALSWLHRPYGSCTVAGSVTGPGIAPATRPHGLQSSLLLSLLVLFPCPVVLPVHCSPADAKPFVALLHHQELLVLWDLNANKQYWPQPPFKMEDVLFYLWTS